MSEYVLRSTQPFKPSGSSLGRLDIELTERCNNRCVHCYINQPEDDQKIRAEEMETGFVLDILKQAADLGCLTACFTGGEPLLRDDFAELYLFARGLGLQVVIMTNACLIDTELVKLFTAVPPGRPIQVSVYGMYKSSYEAVSCVSGSFERFVSGLDLLNKRNIPFVVRQSLLPPNKKELDEFERFASTLPHMHAEPDYTMNFDLRARRDDSGKNSRIRKLRVSSEETLNLLTRNRDKYIKEMREFASRFMRPPGERIFSCGAGQGICVDAYGRAQMCMLLRHPDTVYPLSPDLHRKKSPESGLGPLEYALKEFFPGLRNLRSNNPEYLKRCAVCFLKSLCEQCPAKSWGEHGILDAPIEYLCQVTHTQSNFLGLVHRGENAWEISPENWQNRIKTFSANNWD